jgi:diguanylate cyclase (GGDEF)-like protein/putative nucleotidyltransferase with HDIG domain
LLRAADYGRVASWHLNLDPAIVALNTEAIGRCNGLPVMDRSVQRVLALTADEQCDLGDLVAALEADPALAVNLLRYANSAYVGRPIQAKTVRQAVVMIGRQATRQLCLEAVTFRFFEAAPGNGRMSRGQMHLHAVAVARVAAATATMVSIPTDVPHLAGLLHDCGKLVMPLAFGEEAMDEIAALHPSGAARSAAEWDRFGIDHAYAGALFAEQSGLADELVTAIAWHHGGRRGDVTPNTEIACLQLANTIVGMLAGELPDKALLAGELGALKLSVDALDELAEAAGAGPASTPSAGLGDRVAELERLARMATIRQAMESGASGNVLLCDLDRFKEVNDTHGHSAGDLVLMEVSRILQRHGVAGRIGGDEFAVWVAGDTPIEVADQIVAEVGGAFDSRNGLSVGVSVGVAPMLRDLSAALEAADRALYKAKSAGRGRVQLYDEAPELVV